MSHPVLRRWSRWLLGGLASLVGLVVVIIILLQLSPVATWAGRRLLGFVPLRPGYTLDVSRVSGNWITGLQLEDVALREHGRELAHIDRLRLGYRLPKLLGGETSLRSVTIDGVRAVASRGPDGWDLAHALRSSADTAARSGHVVAIGRFELRNAELAARFGTDGGAGTASDSTLRVRRLLLVGHDLVLGDVPVLAIDTLAAELAPPLAASQKYQKQRWFALTGRGAATTTVFRLDSLRIATDRSVVAGRATVPRRWDDPRSVDRFALRFDAVPLAMADVAEWMPGVVPNGELRLGLRASTANQRMTGKLTGTLGSATLALDGSTKLGTGAPAALRASGTLRGLDPALVYRGAPAGRVNGSVDAELSGPDFKTANGRIDLRVTDTKVGQTTTQQLALQATVRDGRADLVARGTVGRSPIAVHGWVRPFDSIVSYQLAGEAPRLPGTDSIAARLAGAAGAPSLAVWFDVAGRGLALATAQATGHVRAAAVRRSGERVPLGAAPFTLAGHQLVLQPTLRLAGGQVKGHAVVHLGDTVTYTVSQGRIEQVDLHRLTNGSQPDTASAPLSGRFTVTGRGVAPADAVASAKLAVDELRYGTTHLEHLAAGLQLNRGHARLHADAALQGGRLALAATAQPFDSTRAFVVDRASLTDVDVGTLLGRPDLAGPVTLELSGRGTVSGHARAFHGRMRVAPSKLGRIAVRDGALTATLQGQRATFDGTLHTNGGALALAGTVTGIAGSAGAGGAVRGSTNTGTDVVPVVTIERGRFDSLDLATLLGKPRFASRLNGRLTASATGLGGGLDSLRAKLDVELQPSRLHDDTLRDGRLALDLDRGRLQGGVQLTTSDDRFAGQLALRTTSDTLGLASVAGTITAAGGFRNIRIDSLRVVLDSVPGAIAVDTLLLRSNIASLDGRGRVALRPSAGADTLRLVGYTTDLTPLAALAHVDTVAVDSAHLTLAVTGPARHWQLTGDADLQRLLYAGRQVGRLVLHAGATVDSTHLTDMAGELELKDGLLGHVRVSEATVLARYGADSTMALHLAATLQDTLHVAGVISGVRAGDTIRTTVQELSLVEGGRTWALEQPAAVMVRPRIVVDGLALRSGDHRITLNGTLDRRGTSDLALRAEDLDLDVFRDLGLSPVPGRLDGYLHLTGPADAPDLEGKVGLTVRRKDQTLGRIATNFSWTAHGLALDATAVPATSKKGGGGGGQLTAHGTLPWQFTLAGDSGASVRRTRGPRDTLGFVVRADSFDLAFFDPLLPPDAATDLHGALVMDARVSGDVDAPRADGRVQLANVGVSLPPLGVSYEHGELAGDFTGTALEVRRLQLQTDKHETLTAQGRVDFRPLTNPALDLTAQLSDFRVSNSPTLHSVASGTVQLAGTAELPVLTGRLQLGRSEILQGTAGKTTAVRPVELTQADLRELAEHFGPAAARHVGSERGFVDRFRLNLAVSLPGNVWFRRRVNPKADIELSGQVRIRQEPGGEMQFFGRVEPTPNRGFFDVYGRNFHLTGGSITLAGPVDSMLFDVTAEYQVPTQAGPDQGIVVDVAAKGKPDSLGLQFSADPDMDRDDIISYIVTGRPASENPLGGTGTTSPGEAGAELVFGGLSERLAGSAAQALGLDVFQIKQDGLRGLVLTAGRYVAPRVFLSLQQPIQLSTDAQQTPGTGLGPGFRLEYSMRPWLRADLRGGSLPARFLFRGHYAY